MKQTLQKIQKILTDCFLLEWKLSMTMNRHVRKFENFLLCLFVIELIVQFPFLLSLILKYPWNYNHGLISLAYVIVPEKNHLSGALVEFLFCLLSIVFSLTVARNQKLNGSKEFQSVYRYVLQCFRPAVLARRENRKERAMNMFIRGYILLSWTICASGHMLLLFISCMHIYSYPYLTLSRQLERIWLIVYYQLLCVFWRRIVDFTIICCSSFYNQMFFNYRHINKLTNLVYLNCHTPMASNLKKFLFLTRNADRFLSLIHQHKDYYVFWNGVGAFIAIPFASFAVVYLIIPALILAYLSELGHSLGIFTYCLYPIFALSIPLFPLTSSAMAVVNKQVTVPIKPIHRMLVYSRKYWNRGQIRRRYHFVLFIEHLSTNPPGVKNLSNRAISKRSGLLMCMNYVMCFFMAMRTQESLIKLN